MSVSPRRIDCLEAGFGVAHAIASGQVSSLNNYTGLLSSIGIEPGRCIDLSTRECDIGAETLNYLEHSVESLQPGRRSIAIWFLLGIHTIYLLSRADDVRYDPVMPGTLKNPFELSVGAYRNWLAEASMPQPEIQGILELIREGGVTPDRKAVIVRSVIDNLREMAHRQDSQDVWNQVQTQIDLTALVKELAILTKALKQEAETEEQFEAVKHVEAAEREAKAGNGPKMIEYLKKGGSWVFETASKIGISVVEKVIESTLGL